MSYRQIYNKAKSLLAQRHNEELHSIMSELGYTKEDKKSKKEVEPKEEVLSPKEAKKEEKIVEKAQKEIDKIVKSQLKA
jgi:hypothetical protein